MWQYPTYDQYKDSGIEWLNEFPEHWDFGALKNFVSIPVTDGPHETPEFIDSGIPFISAEAIKNGHINFEKKRGYISEALHNKYSKKYKPKFNDIYLIKSGATTGNIAIVNTEAEFNIWSPLAAIRCDIKKMKPAFIYYFLVSKNFQSAIRLNWSFGTQQNIGMKVLERFS